MMMCDKHNVKMILESAQILSTAHRVLDGAEYADKFGLYKVAHKNHPSTVWTRSSHKNYLWHFDLFKAMNYLSKRITRWDAKCDTRLHRLMCYVYSTQEDQMVGWIGDDPEMLTGHLFCDADFAGCPYTLRSTSGVHADIQGPNSRFPFSAG